VCAQAICFQTTQFDFANENLADSGRLRALDAARMLLRDLTSLQELQAKLLKNKVCSPQVVRYKHSLTHARRGNAGERGADGQ
jgi:hypothetical protein